MNVLGQCGKSLQFFLSSLAPTQFCPPCCGLGFVQLRKRSCVPSPHVLEHVLQWPQSDHAPWTTKTKNVFFSCYLHSEANILWGNWRATNSWKLFRNIVNVQWRHYVSVGPGAWNNLGPHKVMTYINGAGVFSTKNIFEFKVSEMAFPAFWEHLSKI